LFSSGEVGKEFTRLPTGQCLSMASRRVHCHYCFCPAKGQLFLVFLYSVKRQLVFLLPTAA
jgi:hypothetical protein